MSSAKNQTSYSSLFHSQRLLQVFSFSNLLSFAQSHLFPNPTYNPFKEVRTEILAICSIYLIMDFNFSAGLTLTSVLLLAILLALILDKNSQHIAKTLKIIFISILFTLPFISSKAGSLRLYTPQLILIATNNALLAIGTQALAIIWVIFNHSEASISNFHYSLANLLLLFLLRRQIPKKQLTIDNLRAKKDSLEAQVSHLQSQLQENLNFYRKFVLNLSQEFRNPLNNIMGNIDLLHKETLDTESASAEQLKMAKLGCENLLNSLNNVLDYSKVETDELDIHSISANIRKTLERSWSSLAEILKQNGVQGELYLHRNTPTLLLIDPCRLHQILLNLVQSSAKLTKKGMVKIVITWHPINTEKDDEIELDNAIASSFGSFPPSIKTKSAQNTRTLINSAMKSLEVERSNSLNNDLSKLGENSDFGTFYPSMNYFKLDLQNHKFPKGQHQKLFNADDHYLGYLKIKIMDTSAGIPNSILSTLFHKFSDFPPDLNQSVAEGGLGLWITRKLCQKLEGDIQVFSEPNKGSTYIAFLKAEISPQSIGTPTPSPIRKYEKRLNLTSMSLKLFGSQSTGTTGTSSIFKTKEPVKKQEDVKLSGMVIESIPYNQQLSKQFLEACSVDVKYIASNGLDAVNEFVKDSKSSYDIIFVDINMPGMDGKETIAKLREFEKQNNLNPTIIVIVTDNCSKAELTQCLDKKGRIRANHFYRKPMSLIDCQNLIRLIRREKVRKTTIIPATLNVFSNHTLIYEKDLFQQVLLENYMKVAQLKYKVANQENILKNFANGLDTVNAILYNCEQDEEECIKFAKEAKNIMAKNNNRKIPLFGIIDKKDLDKMENLKKAGFKDFLVKPFDYDNVAKLLSYPMVQAQNMFE